MEKTVGDAGHPCRTPSFSSNSGDKSLPTTTHVVMSVYNFTNAATMLGLILSLSTKVRNSFVRGIVSYALHKSTKRMYADHFDSLHCRMTDRKISALSSVRCYARKPAWHFARNPSCCASPSSLLSTIILRNLPNRWMREMPR